MKGTSRTKIFKRQGNPGFRTPSTFRGAVGFKARAKAIIRKITKK